MKRTTPPFRADHVGSYLRTPAIHEARAKREKGEISAADAARTRFIIEFPPKDGANRRIAHGRSRGRILGPKPRPSQARGPRQRACFRRILPRIRSAAPRREASARAAIGTDPIAALHCCSRASRT